MSKNFDAIILAAGSSERFDSENPKQFLMIGGQSIINICVNVISSHPRCEKLMLVINKDYIKILKNFKFTKKIFIINGGKTRSESVYNALLKLNSNNNILIHDVARPGVSHAIINNLIKELKKDIYAVIPGLIVNDSLAKKINHNESSTIIRKDVYKIQTPQLFNSQAINLKKLKYNPFITDEAELVRKDGKKVKIISGDEQLHKITYSSDFKILKQLLYNDKKNKVGSGYDVHKFSLKKGPLVLCGIKIPYKFKLQGHSDADVCFHALTDAILGSISKRDIGYHFPPSDIKWKNANSSLFLGHAIKLLKEKEGEILNIDMTIICEDPKLSKYIPKMIKSISKFSYLNSKDISIKATTTEGLGFTGRKEGIACLVNILVNV